MAHEALLETPASERQTQKAADESLLKEARDRWNAADEAESGETGQRARILLAKQFRAGAQWPETLRIQRNGGMAIQGQPPTPARPCLTIDRLSQPCRQISNSIKTANFAIDVLPNGFGADTETAEIFKGYLRYVQNRARGESPVEWAADQAIEGGIGWFRLRTQYVYDSPEGVPQEAWHDQELVMDRVANNLSVYADPFAVKPTKSDMRYLLITEDLPKGEFKRRWPDANIEELEELASTGDAPKGWVQKDSLRIAEYWTVTPTRLELGGRVFYKPVVRGYKITASQVLERWDWVGTRIPFVPVYGEELNVDGKPYLRGVIEPGMDAQRMVNYTYSGAIEIFALGSKSQRVVADDQIADYKAIWDTANTTNWAYLPYKPITVGGQLVGPPLLDAHEAPIQAAAMLLQVSEDGVKATTGIWDSSLGQQTSNAKSGRAIQALQGQSDLGSSNYPDNVRRALIYAGELMVEIAPKITRPGQLLHILGVDDQPKQVIIGQPFVEEKGQARPVQPGAEAQYEKGMVKFYDFRAGRYAVTVSVGKSYSTKREEGAAAIGELIPGLPPAMAAVAAPEYVENLSFPGAHKLAETMRKALPPELQEQDQNDVQAQLTQAQQQLMQMQQAMQEMQPLADKNRVELMKAEAQAQSERDKTLYVEQQENARAAAKIAADERSKALDNLVKLAIAEIGADARLSQDHAEQVRDVLGFEHQHNEAALAREHASGEAERDRGLTVEQAERDRIERASHPGAGA